MDAYNDSTALPQVQIPGPQPALFAAYSLTDSEAELMVTQCPLL
jgi:hypothetical protein